MSIVFVLVILSMMLVGFAVWAFFWAVKNNQFDDLDTPAFSILDDKQVSGKKVNRTTSEEE